MDNALSELKLAFDELDEKQKQLREKFHAARNSDFFVENEKLRAELEDTRRELEQSRENLEQARDDIDLLERNLRHETSLRRSMAVQSGSERMQDHIFTALTKERGELERISNIIKQDSYKIKTELKALESEEARGLWQPYEQQ